MKRFIYSLIALTILLAVCFGTVACKKKGDGTSDGESVSAPTSESVSESVSTPTSESEMVNVTVKLSETTKTVKADEIFNLTATVTPVRSVRWTSSDDKVAAVSSTGRVIAKKEGTATITAEAEGSKATCSVTVTAADTSEYYILTDKTEYLTAVGTETPKTINAKVYLSDGNGDRETSEEVKFESLDESVATVSESGVITPVSVGTTEIIVSGAGVNTYVTADVYTAAITTPQEWLGMFKEDYKHEDRYYLENDIDFTGVTYDYALTRDYFSEEENSKDYKRDLPKFCAEVNGNFHTVKNITQWRDKRYTDSSKDACQAIFGTDIFGMRLRNISFKNIRFTKSDCAVIADSMRMHRGDKEPGESSYETKISNVNIEAIYDVDGWGLFKTVYGGSMENVFAYLRKSDGTAFGSGYGCVVREDYLYWQLGTSEFTNVIVYAEGGMIWEKAPSSVGITLKNSYISATRQDALYRAFTTFDKSVWKLSEKTLPEFVAG